MHQKMFPTMVMGALCCALLACNQTDPMMSTDGASESGQGPSSGPSTGDVADGPDTDADTTMGSGGTATTSADNGSDTDEPPPPPLEGDYYPLVDGATWTYRHEDDLGVVWDEIVLMREVDYQGMTAYEAEDNEDANMESTIAVLVRDGTRTHRVHKDVSLVGLPIGSVDYDPGFMRFDEGWQDVQDGTSVDWSYDRTAYDPDGVMVGVVESRLMIFTVESTSTEVTVPAGTFDCVQVRRERLDTGEVKRYWFAKGVGKVRHETLGSNKSEELIEYAIP